MERSLCNIHEAHNNHRHKHTHTQTHAHTYIYNPVLMPVEWEIGNFLKSERMKQGWREPATKNGVSLLVAAALLETVNSQQTQTLQIVCRLHGSMSLCSCILCCTMVSTQYYTFAQVRKDGQASKTSWNYMEHTVHISLNSTMGYDECDGRHSAMASSMGYVESVHTNLFYAFCFCSCECYFWSRKYFFGLFEILSICQS